MQAANDNGRVTPSVLTHAVRRNFANILRVMRGAGRPYEVLGNFEQIAATSIANDGDAGKRYENLQDILAGLTSWQETLDVESDREWAEHEICRAALRMIAAQLDNSRIQNSAAARDLWGTINAFYADRESSWEERRQREVEEHVRAVLERDQERDNLGAANDRAISRAGHSDCYVYFVTDGEAIKIGKANNPKSRLSGLQTSHHKALTILALVPGDEVLEKSFHAIFHSKRIRGEWFSDCAEIRTLIDGINSGKYEAASYEAAA